MALEKGKQTGKCSYSHNILTHLQLDLEKSGNVVLSNFHFCTKEKKWLEAADFLFDLSSAWCSGIKS